MAAEGFVGSSIDSSERAQFIFGKKRNDFIEFCQHFLIIADAGDLPSLNQRFSA